MDKFKEILAEQYTILPDELKKYTSLESWKNVLKNILVRFNLSPDDSEMLNVRVIFVLFGLESYKDFERNLYEQGFSVPKEIGRVIVNDIFSSIFKPVQTYLDEVDIKEKENESVVIDSGEVVNKTQVLDEVENPIKTPPAFERAPNTSNGSNIIDDKLNKVVKLPSREEHTENKTFNSPQNKYSTDPYREPIE